jgi:hypothetical protein
MRWIRTMPANGRNGSMGVAFGEGRAIGAHSIIGRIADHHTANSVRLDPGIQNVVQSDEKSVGEERP